MSSAVRNSFNGLNKVIPSNGTMDSALNITLESVKDDIGNIRIDLTDRLTVPSSCWYWSNHHQTWCWVQGESLHLHWSHKNCSNWVTWHRLDNSTWRQNSRSCASLPYNIFFRLWSIFFYWFIVILNYFLSYFRKQICNSSNWHQWYYQWDNSWWT